MPRKNGKTKKDSMHVTLNGARRMMTLDELKTESKPLTTRDLERIRKLGQGLFRSDKEFEEFQNWLRESRQPASLD